MASDHVADRFEREFDDVGDFPPFIIPAAYIRPTRKQIINQRRRIRVRIKRSRRMLAQIEILMGHVFLPGRLPCTKHVARDIALVFVAAHRLVYHVVRLH